MKKDINAPKMSSLIASHCPASCWVTPATEFWSSRSSSVSMNLLSSLYARIEFTPVRA